MAAIRTTQYATLSSTVDKYRAMRYEEETSSPYDTDEGEEDHSLTSRQSTLNMLFDSNMWWERTILNAKCIRNLDRTLEQWEQEMTCQATCEATVQWLSSLFFTTNSSNKNDKDALSNKTTQKHKQWRSRVPIPLLPQSPRDTPLYNPKPRSPSPSTLPSISSNSSSYTSLDQRQDTASPRPRRVKDLFRTARNPPSVSEPVSSEFLVPQAQISQWNDSLEDDSSWSKIVPSSSLTKKSSRSVATYNILPTRRDFTKRVSWPSDESIVSVSWP